jgi:hypothetical protein
MIQTGMLSFPIINQPELIHFCVHILSYIIEELLERTVAVPV